MKTAFEILSYGILSLLLVLIIIPFLRNIAIKANFVDKPNYRKVHVHAVPLVGGVAIAFVMLIVILSSSFKNVFFKDYLSIFVSAFILLIVGIIDDKNDISAKFKLATQFILAFIIALSGTRITSLYGLMGIYEIAVWAQYVLTILIITGVVNAFNLMDGVDGLIGGISLLGFSIFLSAAIYFKDYFLAFLSTAFIGTIIGFLKFNLGKKKIFMGDSGSLFIGFILITEAIKFIQKNEIQKDQDPGFIILTLIVFFSIPVFDSLRVYLGRIKKGNSPFSADKSHLHHLLLGAGLAHKNVALMIFLVCFLLFSLGFSLKPFLSITLIILVLIVSFSGIVRLLLMINILHDWKYKLKKMENEK